MVLRVEVSIEGSEPLIWRLLDIDASLTLDKVHEVLQTAVGWRDVHLHSFTDTDPYRRLRPVGGRVPEPRRWVSRNLLEDSDEDLLETDWSLGEILTPDSGPVFYEYDFGDSWTHRLELTEILPTSADTPQVRLVDGARRAPLEDSGGIGGYHDLLDTLADPSHDEFESLTGWVAWTAGPWQDFDPERLHIDAVNTELALLFPAHPAEDAGFKDRPVIHEIADRLPRGMRREFRSMGG
ncbi:plasmid pRiA4b ORF-3 family protein [Arthrobacter sp. Br18]|uniref:plasmid pRiA4b ORF-3 family protein n=1 Tax=Arthrobacter sp. Br18 TaxID=1312954 RepID=UPI0004AF7253|nr:plasmid pRiA4b ORF-3 family protein [Arthrobacter sp. Br18]